MNINLTREELNVLEDCLIWKEIEEQKWIRKTEDSATELDRAIYKSSCKEVANIKEIQRKIREAIIAV